MSYPGSPPSDNDRPRSNQSPFYEPQNQNQNQNRNQHNAQRPRMSYPQSMPELTAEDLQFAKNIRRESFYTRFLPISLASCGAYYFYTKRKGSPQYWSRYLALSFASYVFSLTSYGSTFKQRLAESKLNTPFMQELRRVNGIKQVSAEFDDDRIGGTHNSSSSEFSPTYGNSDSNHKTSWGDPGFSKEDSSFDSDKPLNQEPKKPTSYEELRARNRGYSK